MRDANDLANVIEGATILIKHKSGQWQLADDGKAMIVAALRASQSEAVERDAARYRWLREPTGTATALMYEGWYGEELDGMIDAAMSSQSAPEVEG